MTFCAMRRERRGAVLYGWIEGEQSDLVGVATDNNSFPAVHEQQQLVNVVERSGGSLGIVCSLLG